MDYFYTKELAAGYGKEPVVKGANLHLQKGEIVTLIGPNGAGKTTLLKSIIRQLEPLGGVAVLEGRNLAEYHGKELASRLSVVLTERIRPERMTCREVIGTGRYPYTGMLGVLSREDKQAVERAMEQVGVTSLADREFTRISDGQRQRVLLARAIAQEPDILVLGKALTGGYLGHAVTVASRKVYEGFYDDCPEHALMHGPTFMGNALACRLALQSIALFEEQDYLAKIRRMEQITRRELAGFSHPSIREIRIMGGCVCIEVFDPAVLRGYQQFAYERGVFSRPFLQYLYAMVPYIIEEEELVTVLRTMKAWFLR